MSRLDAASIIVGLTFGYSGLIALDLFLAWRRKQLKEWVRAWRE